MPKPSRLGTSTFIPHPERWGRDAGYDGLERTVDGIRPTTAELEKVRDRVIFTGKLGQAM
jgi:hypothetical protein